MIIAKRDVVHLHHILPFSIFNDRLFIQYLDKIKNLKIEQFSMNTNIDKKNIFENPFEKFINQAKAQGTDIVLSPTLPVDPSIGNPGITQTVTTTPTPTPASTTNKVDVIVTTEDASNLKPGDTFKMKIEIKSGTIEVSAIKLVFNYSKNKLVVDSSEYLDGYFTIGSGITVDEDAETITISGGALDTANTINREYAEITFSVESIGQIEITPDTTQSYIRNGSGQNVIGNIGQINFSVGDVVVSQSPTQTGTPSQQTNVPTATYSYKVIPKSDFDDVVVYLPFAAGAAFILIGVWLSKLKHHNNDVY